MICMSYRRASSNGSNGASRGFLLAEQRLHVVRNLSVKCRSHMAIGVERQRDRTVAEELLNDLGMNAAIEQMGGGSVPEVVDPDSWECGLIEGSMKPLRRPGSVDWSSDWRCKDELSVVPRRSCCQLVRDLAPAVLHQCGYRSRRHIHGAPTAGGLGLDEDIPDAGLPLQRSLNNQSAHAEVDVNPE